MNKSTCINCLMCYCIYMDENKRGRKKVPDHLKAKNRTIRMTDEFWEWFKELGGTKYLVMMIRKDKEKL